MEVEERDAKIVDGMKASLEIARKINALCNEAGSHGDNLDVFESPVWQGVAGRITAIQDILEGIKKDCRYWIPELES